MVGLLKPKPGMRVYDPACGSGGMLILSKEYVEEHGGDARDLGLYGQEDNGGVWSICKMNMILHGIQSADIENDDTLLTPRHLDGGELMRFDRVITNPPFSQNYSQDGMQFKERFAYGFAPETGKKADLMFAQHMLAALRPQGLMATVMPHGVLFRGGAEGRIRRGFVESDVIEAVIGLGPNLFYGTGIPACILVMRPKGTKAPERKGKILFINADQDYFADRAQNYLRPEHIEKITSTFDSFAEIPRYSAVVPLEELLANNGVLSIRSYADNSPPPEPQDVLAHLFGGVPRVEGAVREPVFRAHGLASEAIFVDRDDDYVDFCESLSARDDLRQSVLNDTGVSMAETALQSAVDAWWSEASESIAALPDTGGLMTVRQSMLSSFAETLREFDLLNRFEIDGIVATWWFEVRFDLRTLASQGRAGLLDSWVRTTVDGLENAGPALGRGDDAFSSRVLGRLVPEEMERIDELELELADVDVHRAEWEAEDVPEDESDDDIEEAARSKGLERQLRELKASIKDAATRVSYLCRGPGVKDQGSIAAQKKLGMDTSALEAELATLEAETDPVRQLIEAAEDELRPFRELGERGKEIRRQIKTRRAALAERLVERRRDLEDDQVDELALTLLKDELDEQLGFYVGRRREAIIGSLELLWDKYRVPLRTIEEQRRTAETELQTHLRELAYVE